MADKNKPLPKPPNKAFGNKKRFEEDDDQSTLIADRMAAAMAEGKLDEFIKQELPDNEYARNLVSMMMGMTGMLPMGGGPASSPSPAQQPVAVETIGAGPEEQISPAAEVPEDVRKAIESGDVKGLKDILRREYLKRTPGAEPGISEEAAQPQTQASGLPAIDKDVIDAMIQIAKDNSVTMDWMILRAIKVYVEEYRKTGKL
jgi:hypothetical protein